MEKIKHLEAIYGRWNVRVEPSDTPGYLRVAVRDAPTFGWIDYGYVQA